MTLLAIFLLLSSFFFSILLNTILFRFSRNLGVHNNGEDGTIIRWGSTSKPTVGGITFFIVFIFSSLVFFIARQGEMELSREFLGLLLAVTLGFIIGFSDDAYDTKPLLKLAGQILVALVMIFFGVHINLVGNEIIDYTLTIFWVVGIMNSINLLDNMDGVTGLVSLIIVSIAIAIISLYPGRKDLNPYFLSMIAMAGGLVGFLVLNWKPSKIYMGDAGSQFLGALLAFVGVKFFWNIQGLNSTVVHSMQVITPLMVFLVPIMDTSFVTIARTLRGQSPMVGGKDHLSHHLVFLGVQERWVPVILGLVSLLSGSVAIFTVRYVFQWNHWYTAIFSCYIVINFVIFFYLYKRGEKLNQMRNEIRKKEKSNASSQTVEAIKESQKVSQTF